MSMPTMLATKLYIPPVPAKIVVRPRLIERLNASLDCKLTLISAPAGSGKTTLVSEWLAACDRPAAWLSLDEGDSDPARFLTYFAAAVQTIAAGAGAATIGLLRSPQPPSAETILTSLLHELAAIPDDFILVLDDYHLVDAKPVDGALTFLLEHLPSRMHLVIATREDPHLPLARLRARGQLTELRAADLRFTAVEAASFLNEAMCLDLSRNDTDALENRTEGWITGLQLAAISMQGTSDTTGFIRSFTGSHHFVLDYLVEEVLQRQSESVQEFLLKTSILERLCGPLCDAVVRDSDVSGQETLEHLQRANLFVIPLDDERRWYRYHHLFADLLRQRLRQVVDKQAGERELHVRARLWFEENGLEIEAFQHAAAAGDIDRATRLLQGKGIPLHLRGGMVPVLSWLDSLPAEELDKRPVLWVMHAGALTVAGQTVGVEEMLGAAEKALAGAGLDDETRDLIGRIANNRATLAISRYDADEAIEQANRALDNLRPENLPVRSINMWVLGTAHLFKRENTAAGRTYAEALSISRAIGQTFVTKLATIGMGDVQRADNRLHEADATYRQALELFGDQPLPIASEAQLGLAMIDHEWNDIDAAEHHGLEGLRLARQYPNIIDRSVACEVFLARLKIARGDIAGAASDLDKAGETARQSDFVLRLPEIAAEQVLVLLRQGKTQAAAAIARSHDLPISQARVLLAEGDAAGALAVLKQQRQRVERKGWKDELLKVMVLQSVALYMKGDKDEALRLLGESLALAEPGGFIRLFIDEGAPMAELLTDAAARGIMPEYVHRLLAESGEGQRPAAQQGQPLEEPLSDRELEVLGLIAEGLSNREIARRLFLALSTVKGHNRIIFSKLRVQRRTEAVARARELGLL